MGLPVLPTEYLSPNPEHLLLLSGSFDNESRQGLIHQLRDAGVIVDMWFQLPVGLTFQAQSQWFVQHIRSSLKQGRRIKQLILAGGDGTIQIALAGYVEYCRQYPEGPPDVMLIPRGTGNLLAQNLGLPLEADTALTIPSENTVVELPIAFANDDYFVLIASVGATSQVMEETQPWLKRIIGIWAYLLTGIRIFMNSRHNRYWLTTPEGDIQVSAKTLLINHSATYLGPFMPLVSQADPLEKTFAISAISFPSIRDHWQLVKDLLWPQDRKSFQHTVQTFKATEVSVRTQQGKGRHLSQLDGNMIGQLPLRIGFSPYCMRVFVPSDSPEYMVAVRERLASRHCADRYDHEEMSSDRR